MSRIPEDYMVGHRHVHVETDRDKQALDTINTLLTSVTQAHQIIEEIMKTVMAMHKRIAILEKADQRRPRLIHPSGAA